MVSGAAFVVAPTGILAGAGVGLLWGLGKFGWRRFARKARKGGGERGSDPRRDERADAGEEREVVIRAPRADPW